MSMSSPESRPPFRAANPGRAPSQKRRRKSLFRPRLEALEDRAVPAVFTGDIGGFAFIDRSGTGTLGAGDTTLAGIPVELFGTTSQGTTVDTTLTTDASGAYHFLNVL